MNKCGAAAVQNQVLPETEAESRDKSQSGNRSELRSVTEAGQANFARSSFAEIFPRPDFESQRVELAPDRVYKGLLYTISSALLMAETTESRKVKVKDPKGRVRSFEYGLALGRHGAPLVFMIPGFGCPHDEKTALYLSQVIHKQGFHVATLHSPSHPKFLLDSHHSGIPGVTSEDSGDALLGIKAIRQQLSVQGLSFSETHLVGYSMGALNAAFVQYLDRSGSHLFSKTVLINPPINMAYGMKQLDFSLDALRMSVAAKTALIAKVSVFVLMYRRLKLEKAFQMKLFLKNTFWSETELRALIGYNFEKTFAGGVEAAHRLGLLSPADVVSNFTEFCETATVGHYRNFYPGATSADLFHSESLLKIGPRLAADGNVTIMHNEDDFLLGVPELHWLKNQFGEKARIFTTGGHLGNVWRQDFQLELARALVADELG